MDREESIEVRPLDEIAQRHVIGVGPGGGDAVLERAHDPHRAAGVRDAGGAKQRGAEDAEHTTEHPAGAGDRLRRKTLAPEELEFYCSYFARPEVWSVPDDLRTDVEKLSAENVKRVHYAPEVDPFDAIVCDLMMPQVSGMEVYRELSRLAPATILASKSRPK